MTSVVKQHVWNLIYQNFAYPIHQETFFENIASSSLFFLDTYFDDNGDLITTLTEFEPPDFWKEDELYLDEGEDCLVYNLSVFVCEKRGPKKSLSELLSPINFLPLSFFTPICLRLHSSPIEVWEGGGEGYLLQWLS